MARWGRVSLGPGRAGNTGLWMDVTCRVRIRLGSPLSPGWTPLPWQCLPGSATSGMRQCQTPPVCQCQLLQRGSLQPQTPSGKGWAELGHQSGVRLQESLGAEIGQLKRNETHPTHGSYTKLGITDQPAPLVFSSPSDAFMGLLQLFHTYFVLCRIHHKVQYVPYQILWPCRDSHGNVHVDGT